MEPPESAFLPPPPLVAAPQRSLNHLLPPTPQQRIAVGDLHSSRLSSTDRSIFDWLNIVRSARNEIQPWRSISPLTDKEFIALAALSSADDENIREWFRDGHTSDTISKAKYEQSRDLGEQANNVDSRYSTNSADSSFGSSQASSRKFPRSSAYPTPRSSLYSFSSKHSSLPQNDIHSEDTKFASTFNGSLPTNFCDSLVETPETVIASPPSEIGSKKYRCTTGEHLPKACSSKFAAFRRHELEHVERYHCIPRDQDLIYDTTRGQQCLLCGERNPDRGHFGIHHIESCLERDEPTLFTRQDILAKHLKEKHAVPADRTKLLTRKWSYQVKKTAFSCGICVGMLFGSKLEQISHVQRKHSSEGMQFWSETTMIRNLLRHPEVNPAWQQILAQHPRISEQYLFWPQAVLERVHLELDLNSETAENFAAAAFRSAKLDSEMTHAGDTRFPLRLAAELNMDHISEPSFVSPSFPAPHGYIDTPEIESSAATGLEPWHTTDSICDTMMPLPAQQTEHSGIADHLATFPCQSDALQQPFTRTSGHEILDEPIDNLLSEALNKFVDPRRTVETRRQGLCGLETSTDGVDTVEVRMNLLLEQRLHNARTTRSDPKSGMGTTVTPSTPHARVDGQLHSKFSRFHPHNDPNTPEKARPKKSPIKRKVSAGKAKGEDTQRRPWTTCDDEFEFVASP